MIIVKNRELLIPGPERYIGTTYDTESENRQFLLSRFAQNGVDLSALTFRLDLKYANDATDTVVLEKEVTDTNIILTWDIGSSVLQVPGTLFIQIRAVDDEVTVKWSSFHAALYVERHLNTPGTYSGSLTEIEQMEQDHQYMKGVVDELKSHLDYTHEAEAWAIGKKDGEDVPSTDETYHNNSKYYSQQAGSSATAAANSATAAAESAAQAAETVTDTNTRFNNAVAAVTSETEVIDARVGADGTTYPVLKNRLDAEHTDVKSALTDIYVLKQYAYFEPGYITANGAIGSTVSLTRHTDSSYESAVMACVPGDTFVVNLHAANAARGWCFIDSNNVMLEKAVAGNRNETITAPENAAKVIFNNATDYPGKQVYRASGTDRITPLYDVREPFAYFTSNAQPTFTLGDGSITVSKNSGNFRIYTNKGLLKTFTALGTHTITNVQKLVYDLDDDQIKVVAGTQNGNYILLLSFAGNNFNGILYPYYLKQQFEDVNSRIDNATDIAAEDFALANVADGSDFKAVFFSDIHGASSNMTSILAFADANASRVDAILNGGDTAARWLNDTTYSLTWYTDAITASSIDILSAIGNHDAWDGSYFTKASAVDIYNAFIAPIVAKYTGIVQPTGAAASGLCYYYKDYASKVRVVVLNAMDESSCDFWDSAQATWLADVLADAKTNDLAVICLEHAPYPLPISVRNAEADNWSTWYPLQTDGVKLETEAMDIVANFMASGGKFVCWLSGHLHEDNLLEATGYPGQLMVNIVTADAGRRNKVGVNTADSSPYFDGFNYIGVDTTNGLLKVYRKGWDMDAGMKKHDYLCYDFVNHQVIAN